MDVGLGGLNQVLQPSLCCVRQASAFAGPHRHSEFCCLAGNLSSFGDALVASVAVHHLLIAMHSSAAGVRSCTFAAVTTTEWINPEALSTPAWTFMPKYHWLPFLVWCISGSRFPSLFWWSWAPRTRLHQRSCSAASSCPVS
jgi:hypothetical protein